MATIKLSSVVADARGKIGGVVFSRNKGGSYARTLKVPINPNTAAQAQVRAFFGTLQTQWRSLTQAQRDSWIAAAPNFPTKNKVGDTIYLTGAQLYSKCNMVLLTSGLPQKETIAPNPVPLTEGGQTETTARNHPWEVLDSSLSSASFAGFFVGGVMQPTDKIEIFASGVVSPGVYSPRSVRFRKIKTIAAADLTFTGQVGVADILADWTSVYGDPEVEADGQVVFLEAKVFSETQGYSIPFGTQRYEFIAQP